MPGIHDKTLKTDKLGDFRVQNRLDGFSVNACFKHHKPPNLILGNYSTRHSLCSRACWRRKCVCVPDTRSNQKHFVNDNKL